MPDFSNLKTPNFTLQIARIYLKFETFQLESLGRFSVFKCMSIKKITRHFNPLKDKRTFQVQNVLKGFDAADGRNLVETHGLEMLVNWSDWRISLIAHTSKDNQTFIV